MSHTLTVLVSTCIAALLVSCEKPQDKAPPAPPPGSPPVPATRPPSEPTTGAPKPAADSVSGTARDVPAIAKDMMKDLSPEAVLGPDVTPEKLKEQVKAAPTDKLTAIADKLLASLESSGNAGGGAIDGIAKSAGLGDLTALKEKLRVVVDELKARGIDVSKYTKVLGV